MLLPPCPLSFFSFQLPCFFPSSSPGPAVSAFPENLFKMQILKPTPDLQNHQNTEMLWVRLSTLVQWGLPGDSDADWSLRTTALKEHWWKKNIYQPSSSLLLLLEELGRGECGRPRPICPHQSICGYFTKLTFITKLILRVKVDTLWISTAYYTNILKNKATQQAW